MSSPVTEVDEARRSGPVDDPGRLPALGLWGGLALLGDRVDQDHKTPSLYVASRLSPGDRVIAFGVPT